jgi:UDP-N-acetylmuramoyl-L-alanyl-D-glutamate--2,6-diaminopimelate ligase
LLLSDLMSNENGGGLMSTDNSAVDIRGLTSDSRDVRPGYLFAAIEGTQIDGRNYIPDAVGQGAVAVLAPPGTATDDPLVPLIADVNPRRRLALMAARFFEKQPECLVAITGTNGKTSVAKFVEQIWHHLGHKSGSLGTLGVQGDGYCTRLEHTTPDPVTMHKVLRELSETDVNHVAIEASSHGLDQYRLDGVRLQAAAFTNLSHDHLDYHPTEEDYFAAKSRLFRDILPAGGTAVLNADSEYHGQMAVIAGAAGQKVISYGTRAGDICIKRRRPNGEGQTLYLDVFGEEYIVKMPVIGDFQAENAACALALVLACGADQEAAIEALNHLRGVTGRIEKVIEHANGAPVFVDFAHTPDALEHVLKALKPHARDRLVVVFGCGGDRDADKRRIMGVVACQFADLVIITDDNPRFEDAAAIRHEVMKGCDRAIEVRDRAEAIRAGVAGLNEGDVLVIAGKGHESGQIIRDEVLPFNDAEQARMAVAEVGGSCI